MSRFDHVMVVAVCLVAAVLGWWTYTHAEGSRFSAGYGSGVSAPMRRFWGAVTAIAALALAVVFVLR